jgi:1-acyl-sn-glycerol-3-phosphate acyltransferase
VPIVPIALSGVFDLLPIHTKHFYPTPLKVQVGEPIDTKGMNVRQNGELTEQVRVAIAEMLGQTGQTRNETPAPVA